MPLDESSEAPCTAHYDIVGPHPRFPDQAKDVGTCIYCGRQRTYKLAMEDVGYNNQLDQRPIYQASEREIVGYMGERMRED